MPIIFIYFSFLWLMRDKPLNEKRINTKINIVGIICVSNWQRSLMNYLYISRNSSSSRFHIFGADTYQLTQYMRVYFTLSFLFFATTMWSCNRNQQIETTDPLAQRKADSLEMIRKAEEKERKRPRTADDIKLSKDFSYDKHTLEETYPNKDTTRQFQLDKIKEKLAYVENFQRTPASYVMLQNRKNKGREAPLVKIYHRNEYKLVSDALGTDRYQAAPLYVVGETEAPTIYGRD